MIASIAEDLWGVEVPFRVAGIRLGARMTVVRLSDGRLWLHSPVSIDDALRAEIDALGSVAHLIAPSKVHHLFVPKLASIYPNAALWGAPGLADKRKDISFHGELGETAPEWESEIEQLLVEGAPLMNEVLFFHRPSRSLIVTDIAFNIASAEHWWTRSYLRMMGVYGGFGQSRMVKLCARDRAAIKKSIDRALDWDFDRVVVTHGAVLESGGKDALRSLFAWL